MHKHNLTKWCASFSTESFRLRSFAIDNKQLRADLHLLKSHPRFASILDIAETMPSSVGLSISFSGASEAIGNTQFARCLELYSVDLVDSPAANPSGLFNAITPPLTDAQLESLARHTYGDSAVDSWANSSLGVREIATRYLYLDGIRVEGLDTRAVAQKFGAVKQPFGLERVRRANTQSRVNQFLAAKTATK